jgi:hypothetical protein
MAIVSYFIKVISLEYLGVSDDNATAISAFSVGIMGTRVLIKLALVSFHPLTLHHHRHLRHIIRQPLQQVQRPSRLRTHATGALRRAHGRHWSSRYAFDICTLGLY